MIQAQQRTIYSSYVIELSWVYDRICVNENNIQNVCSFLFNLLCTICIEFWWPFWWLLLCINLINRLWGWCNIIRHCETILNHNISYVVFILHVYCTNHPFVITGRPFLNVYFPQLYVHSLCLPTRKIAEMRRVFFKELICICLYNNKRNILNQPDPLLPFLNQPVPRYLS